MKWVQPKFFKSFFYCQKCLGVVNEKTCPHGDEYHLNFSGTGIREMLTKGEGIPEELMRPEVVEIILGYKKPYVE